MKYGSVCSGIEAASAAWHPLGWQASWFSEIEPFPCSVLKHHYPDVPNLGDMTKWETWPDEPIDVLVGGTPCQSFSVAGLRGGLSDPRGGLMLQFLGIADRYKPRWIVWENVPGVLSSNSGRDFGTFLGALGELGYGWAYRVMDAQWFGVAQRRRRVFVVGYLGDQRSAASVLFERESVRRDNPPSRDAREGVAGTLSSRTTAGGGLGTDFDLAGGLQAIPPLTARDAGDGAPAGGSWWDGGQLSQTLDAVLAKGQTMPEKNRFPAVLVPEICRQWPAETASTLYAIFGHTLGLDNQHINEGAPLFVPAAQPIVLMDQGGSVMNTLQDGTVGTLRREMHGHEPVVAFSQNQLGELRQSGEVFNTINTNSNASGRNTPMVAMGFDGYNNSITGDQSKTLDTGQDHHHVPIVMTDSVAQPMRVRRLTTTECERLQGFPDGYTQVPYRNKPAADGPRYKALGNSMAVPVMAWIGRRIQMVEELIHD